MTAPRPLRFSRSMRLSSDRDFQRVFAARMTRRDGPLVMYARPNELGHSRLGLTVSRKVGGAVRRNRIKRLLREAFRLQQHEMPAGYDLVVVVKPHETLTLDSCRDALANAMIELDRRWQKRSRINQPNQTSAAAARDDSSRHADDGASASPHGA